MVGRISQLGRLLSLKREERALLLEALRLIARIRLALTLKRFDRVRDDIVAYGASRPPTLSNLRKTVWAVQAMARFVPKATCLTQALAGQMLLARRGESSTVRLSIAADRDSELKPHAWLVSGDTILLGGDAEIYSRHRPLADYDSSHFAARSAEIRSTER